MATPSVSAHATLAIVGGGPKAVAIAAMAHAVHAEGGPKIDIKVFDHQGIGANWGGATGYTDGEQRLCTFAERDLGFPYAYEYLVTGAGTSAVSARLAREFSWQAFLAEQGNYALGEWVDDGRNRPLHSRFKGYLEWAFAKTGQQWFKDKVTSLAVASNRWVIHCNNDPTLPYGPYDGVVLTGPGPARLVKNVGNAPGKVFDGQDFWTSKPAVTTRLGLMKMKPPALEDSEKIVIVGAGGTAAAILGWLVENGAAGLDIQVIAGSQAALHMRAENPFENRLFEDSMAWQALKPETRRAFTGRLNRGVVWEAVLDRISHARNINVIEGFATKYVAVAGQPLEVHYEAYDPAPPATVPSKVMLVGTAASLLIDASGFNDMWWTTLFPAGAALGTRGVLEDTLGDHLELRQGYWTKRPPLHAPMLSTMVGPGYASLLSLGGMAERILSNYGA